MSTTQKLKDETTKICHSILLASATAMPVRGLENEFLTFEGKRIPYQQLGYVSLDSFLRDCPEFFKIFWDGPQMMVKHVTNEDTKHIEDLIRNQKKKPKKRSVRSSRQIYRPRVYPKPRNQPPPAKMEPVVDSINRGKIRTLLYSYTGGLLGSNFDVAFQKRYGQHITFKALGFNSLYDMFKSMTDIVRIEQMPSGGYKLFPKTTLKSAASQQQQQQAADYKPSNPPRNLPPRLQSNNAQQNRQSAPIKPYQASKDQASRHSVKSYVPEIPQEDMWDENPYDNSGISLVLQKEIQQVLAKFPDGVWASEFPAEYRIKFGRELDRRSQGHDSIISLMSSLPHIVSIQRPNQRDWKLYDVRIKKEPLDRYRNDSDRDSNAANHMGPTSTAPTLNSDMKETIRQVVAHYPQGVLLGELEMVYSELTGEELVSQDLGFATTDALISSTALSDTVKLTYKSNTGVLVFPIYKDNPPRTDRLKKLHMMKTTVRPPLPSRREIPADVCAPGAVYRQQALPKDVQEGDVRYVEVYVSTVTNPSHLWIQLRGKASTDELENLMDELEVTYKDRHRAEAYTLPEEHMSVGQVCAAIYPNDGDWHRCTITGLRDADFVEVYYVDYGSSYVVTKKSLKFLQMRFLKLPAQALKAKLANIRPRNAGEWTKGAKDRLLNLVSNRALVALITNISQDGELSICLTDTSTVKDVHINDVLVAEHLAEMVYPEPEPEPEPEQEPMVEEATADTEKPTGRRHTISQSRSEPYSACGERNIKYVQLTEDYMVHLIKHDDKPHVTSAEISNLLWPQKDMLRSMMRQKKLVLPKVILPKEEYPELFEEFEICQIPGTLDTDSNLKTHVTIFDLTSVVKILEVFNHPCEELKASVQQQIDLFNPNDGYWQGEGDSEDLEEDEDEDEEDDYQYGRQTLETALQSLQFRRKKILHALQDAQLSNPVGLVEDLQNVERQLGDIKKRIHELEKLEAAEGAQAAEAEPSKLTAEEEMVCAVVSEQHDSYVEKNNRQPPPTNNLNRSPTAKVSPLPSSTSAARPNVKTNPVAPMPAEPRTASSSTGAQKADVSTMMSGLSLGDAASESSMANMMMPFGATGSGDAASELLRQQMLLQYQYANMLAMQNLMQQQQRASATSSSANIDPTAFLMQQQALLAAQMHMPTTAGFGRGVANQAAAFDDASPDVSGSRLLGQGRGRNMSNVSAGQPGGLSKKK